MFHFLNITLMFPAQDKAIITFAKEKMALPLHYPTEPLQHNQMDLLYLFFLFTV